MTSPAFNVSSNAKVPTHYTLPFDWRVIRPEPNQRQPQFGKTTTGSGMIPSIPLRPVRYLFGACTNPMSQWRKKLLAFEDTEWYLQSERSSKRTATVDYERC
jgi:hypothetical protein